MIDLRELRDGLRVTGDDAQKYLHSQLSNDVASLPVGDSRYAFALDPAGKVVALCRVVRLGEAEFLLDTDLGAGEPLLARLKRFLIRVDVEIQPVVVRAWCHRGSVEEVAKSSSPVAGAIRVGAWWGDGTAVDHLQIVGSDSSSAFDPDDSIELESTRVRACWPRHGAEIVVGETLPSATGVVPVSVSFSKGCYPGQELVERMDSRGAIAPLVLREVPDTGVLPGEPYVVDGREVGRVTSVAGGRALAYLRRDFAS